jgi:hypothetical protein
VASMTASGDLCFDQVGVDLPVENNGYPGQADLPGQVAGQAGELGTPRRGRRQEKLPAQTIGFLVQAYLVAPFMGSQGRTHARRTAADDHDMLRCRDFDVVRTADVRVRLWDCTCTPRV